MSGVWDGEIPVRTDCSQDRAQLCWAAWPLEKAPVRRLSQAAACMLLCFTVTPAGLRGQRKCIGLAVPWRSFSAVAAGGGGSPLLLP